MSDPDYAFIKCLRCGGRVRVAADHCLACAKPEELFTCPECPELRAEIERLRDGLKVLGLDAEAFKDRQFADKILAGGVAKQNIAQAQEE